MGAEGWIKLHRRLVDWEWYKDGNTARLFLHLLLMANHEDGEWRKIKVERGQVVTGLHALSAQTGISIRSIRTSIERLKTTNNLTVKTTNKYSIITICKYSEYQTAAEENDKQNDKQAVTQTTTNKKIKKKEEKDKKEKREDPFDPLFFRPEFISEKSWADVVLHRRKKKAAETERAYQAIITELEKAISLGFSVEKCVDTMTQRNWTGFEAEWMGPKNGNGQATKTRPESQKAKDAREIVNFLNGQDDGQAGAKAIEA